MTGIRVRIFCSFFSFFIRPFSFPFMIVFRNRGVCVNEPSVTVNPCGKRVRWSSGWRRLTDFARARYWQTERGRVNAVSCELAAFHPPARFCSAITTSDSSQTHVSHFAVYDEAAWLDVSVTTLEKHVGI